MIKHDYIDGKDLQLLSNNELLDLKKEINDVCNYYLNHLKKVDREIKKRADNIGKVN